MLSVNMASGLVDTAIKKTHTHTPDRQGQRGRRGRGGRGIYCELGRRRAIYVAGHNEGDFRICGRFVHLAA